MPCKGCSHVKGGAAVTISNCYKKGLVYAMHQQWPSPASRYIPMYVESLYNYIHIFRRLVENATPNQNWTWNWADFPTPPNARPLGHTHYESQGGGLGSRRSIEGWASKMGSRSQGEHYQPSHQLTPSPTCTYKFHLVAALTLSLSCLIMVVIYK